MERERSILAPPGHCGIRRAEAIPAPIIARTQPGRFVQRSRILRDLTLSDGAARLFLLLDDEARGEPELFIKQQRLAVLTGTVPRELYRRLRELTDNHYIEIRHTMRGNVYVFHRTTESDSNRTAESYRIGPLSPVAYKERARQEIPQEIPPLPPRGGKCSLCRGRGHRSGAIPGTCPGCGGAGVIRRSA